MLKKVQREKTRTKKKTPLTKMEQSLNEKSGVQKFSRTDAGVVQLRFKLFALTGNNEY